MERPDPRALLQEPVALLMERREVFDDLFEGGVELKLERLKLIPAALKLSELFFVGRDLIAKAAEVVAELIKVERCRLKDLVKCAEARIDMGESF